MRPKKGVAGREVNFYTNGAFAYARTYDMMDIYVEKPGSACNWLMAVIIL
ncbi:MAG: hypothetical protein QXI39_02145 [Candidatus Bathyarchaeia archaeon]